MHNASQFHKDQLLNWFMYHLTMEQRGKLAQSLPMAYNDICGQEVCAVVRTSDLPPNIDAAPWCFTAKPNPLPSKGV